MNDAIELAQQPPPMVPQSYAEKAMASLMQLHSDLMEEKERRVDLYRRLMEKEQALAELKMYVKMLEERNAPRAEAAAPPAPVPVQAVTPPPPPVSFVERARAAAPRPVVPQPPPPAPRPVAVAAGSQRPNAWAAPTAEGWRSW